MALVSSNVPVTISQAALIIQEGLRAFADPLGGSVKIIANTAHIWEELSVTKDKPRILICYTGEESRGDSAVRGVWQRVERQWQIIVTRGHGWKNRAAEAAGDSDSFYDVLEGVRESMRKILNIGQEWPPVKYIGMEPLPNVAPSSGAANVFMDAVSQRFTTANDLPRITTQVQANP